ncbi:hypothetical protein DFQ29_008016 [Apophysomyces sp. BC1021]|nr:hypothetical protein DFQ29_008016 [Apophysomyces sp. BC1021]
MRPLLRQLSTAVYLQKHVVLPRGTRHVLLTNIAAPARLTQRFYSAQAITPPRNSKPTQHTLCTYKPVAFYSIVPISTDRVTWLRDTIATKLNSLGVVGRIYLAPASGIGGINCQMSVPTQWLPTVKSFFAELGDFGSIEFTKGLHDTNKPNFPTLSVTVKDNLVATKVAMNTKDLQDQCTHLSPAIWHQELAQKGKDVFLLDMRNHYEYVLVNMHQK